MEIEEPGWSCKLCTNFNDEAHCVCQVCGVPRPNEAKPPRRTPVRSQKRKVISPSKRQALLASKGQDVKTQAACRDDYVPPQAARSIESDVSTHDRYEVPGQVSDAEDSSYEPFKISLENTHHMSLKEQRAKRQDLLTNPKHQRHSKKHKDDVNSIPSDEEEIDANTEIQRKASKGVEPEEEFRKSYYRAKSASRRMSGRMSDSNSNSQYSQTGSSTSLHPKKIISRQKNKSFDYDSDSMTYQTIDTNSSYSTFGDDASIDRNETAIEAVRLERLARLLSPTWFGKYEFSPEYAQRLVNFKYAQQKRREIYGFESPWGIMGLYEHLSTIRNDIRWAEEVERRKEYGLP